MAQKKQETVSLSDLKLLDKNPRRHTEKQITEMIKSVKLFGQYRPLVIDEDNVVLAGNGLFIALSKMGWETAEAYRMIGLSESDRTKLILTDNRLGDMSFTDFGVLEEIIASLEDLEVPGYEEDTLQGILMSTETAAQEAAQYGVLDQETKDRLARNGERLEAAATQAMQPPAPADPPVTATGPTQSYTAAPSPAFQAAPAASDTDEGEGTGVCPTCRRPW